jgi:hypothetical protein
MKNIYLEEDNNKFIEIPDVDEFNKRFEKFLSKPSKKFPVLQFFCECCLATYNMQILKSAAGFFIGYAYYDEEANAWWPNDRISAQYWPNIEEAIESFKTGNYTLNFF